MKIRVEIGTIKPLDNRPIAAVHFEATSVPPTKRHTVLVLDCSTSMTASLPYVRQDSQKYIAELGDTDWASIIIFSGHETSKLISGPTQCTKDGRSLLGRAIEKEVRPISTTVFSEPLKLTLETVKRLAGKDTAHNAVLFTDGCAVPTRWGIPEERKKAFSVAMDLRNFGAVVSVIGYGFHYDEEFIKMLMEAAGNSGVFRHISEIDDFSPTINEIREVFHKTSLNHFDLTFTPNFGSVLSIFKTTPEVCRVSKGDRFVLKSLYDGKVTLFLQLTSASCNSITIRGTIDGQVINETPADIELTDKSAVDFVRTLAAHAFLTGDREAAAELLKLTDDEVLADRTASSYTTREEREVGDVMRRMFRDRKFIGAGLKPTGPNHCVLNVLRELIEDSQNVVFLGKGGYKRSGELTSDPRVIHPPTRTLKVLGYTSHVSRFNFAIRCLKDIKLLPEDGNGSPVDKKIWRTYDVILDGNLWLPELEAVLSEKSFESLQSASVIDASKKHNKTTTYTLDLRGIKMVSSAWSNPTTLGLVTLLREEAELEAEQTALNARRKATMPTTPPTETDIYTEKAAKVDNLPFETYTANCVEIRLMKYKPLTYNCSIMTHDEADTRVKEVRQRLTVVRYLIRAISFAMEVTRSKAIPWGLSETNRYGKLEQMATYQNAMLKKVSWDEKIVCS